MTRTSHARRSLGATVVLTLALAACDGRVGLETREGPPPTLHPGVDASRAPDAGSTPAPDAAVVGAPDASTASPDAFVPPVPGCGSATEEAVIASANASRASMGLGPLTCDPLMASVARAHSQDMCDQGYFSHTALDGRSPFDRMRDAGVRFGTAGENIAQGQRSADEVHEAWMNSPGHRMNILGAAYHRIGVGLAECGGRMDWTQVFAD